MVIRSRISRHDWSWIFTWDKACNRFVCVCVLWKQKRLSNSRQQTVLNCFFCGNTLNKYKYNKVKSNLLAYSNFVLASFAQLCVLQQVMHNMCIANCPIDIINIIRSDHTISSSVKINQVLAGFFFFFFKWLFTNQYKVTKI